MISTLTLLACTLPFATSQHAMQAPAKPAVQLEGLGNHRHPVSTQVAEAQRFFDQGLVLIYAFNHDESAKAFRRAAELDPNLAMAWWGVALALGPNYNLPDVDPVQAKASYDALQKAIQLSATAPEHERAYIQALATRYSTEPKADPKKLMQDYAKAMAALADKYPDDLDAATLAAESAMNLRPWQLWTPDGKPAEGTEKIVQTLERVLQRYPDHPGSNHYYIHAVEASPTPERALPSAARLVSLVPSAGHLVHMPSHIYTRTGDHESSAKVNELAIIADRAYLKRSGAQGIYPLMYFSHNIHFLAYARACQGRYADARQAADDLLVHLSPHLKDMPMLEGFVPMQLLIQVRFHRWQDILSSPKPDAKLQTATALWHFARGMAFIAQGKADEAEQEHKALVAIRSAIPADQMYSSLNKARPVLDVADNFLAAHFALARSDKSGGLGLLRKAVAAEDLLQYNEPPDWIAPVRETLGKVLLQSGEAAEAEQVFRADLERNRRNGRSLFGLTQSLRAQKKDFAAQLIQLEFERAWQRAEPKALTLNDL